MSYTPAWNALFAKPLLNQLIAIIQRDQASALAIVNPSLTPISEFHKGPGKRTTFPWLTVGIDGLSFDDEDDCFRHSRIRIGLSLDAGQFDQEIAQDNAQDYARVLDMVITSANGPDWSASLPIIHETVPSGTTTPNDVGTVKRVFVAEHRYGVVTLEGVPAPVLRVTLGLECELKEQ